VPASRCMIWGQKTAGGALRLKGSKGGLIPPENPFPGAKLHKLRLNPRLRAQLCSTVFLHFSPFFPFFHFLAFEEFWIASHVFVNRSWDPGSREIVISHSPFWRHYRILRFCSFVDKAIDKVAVYEEPSQKRSRK